MKRTFPLALLATLLSLSLTSCLDSLTGSSSGDEEETGASESSGASGEDGPTLSLTELRRQKREIEKEMEALKELQAKAAGLAEEEQKLVTELSRLSEYEEQLNLLNGELETSLDGWRSATRGSFAGVQLPVIQTVDGQRFESVTIKEVGDTDISFTHTGGTGQLPIAQLPPDLRKNLIHEPTVLPLRGN